MKNTLTLLFLVLSFGMVAQNQSRIDSLLNAFETDIPTSKKVDVLILLAREYSRVDPKQTVAYAEQAIALAGTANYYEGISDAYYGLGWVQMQAGDHDSAVFLLHYALDTAKYASYRKGEANAYNGLGIVSRNSGRLDEALEYYAGAFKIYEKINDLKGLSASHNSMAIVHHIKGNNELALKNFSSSLEIDKELGDSIGVASSYNNLGRFYESQGNYVQALKNYFQSLEIKEKLGDQRGMAGTYSNIGLVYQEQEEYEKALSHFLMGLEIHEQLNDKRYIGASYTNMANIYKERQQDSLALNYLAKALDVQTELEDKLGLSKTNHLIGEVHMNRAQYSKAINYFETAWARAKEIDANPGIASALNALGKAHWLMEKPRLAREYLKEAIALAQAIDFPVEVRDGAETLVEVEKALNNFPAALAAYELYHTYYDSLLGEEKAKQLSQLQVQYETEKKEQEIKGLAQQASIQELRLKQSNFNLIILTIVMIVLVLLGTTLYLVYRQRQLALNQKNQDMEQKLLRVQMNPHFIFNAMSAIQDYMVRGDAKQAGIYLTKFSKLIRQVLDNSRTEFISLDQEVSMLDNYLSLQNLRRDRPFTYEIVVAEDIELEEITIPPMFAQPFVENAIEHGMNEETDEAAIKVYFSLKNDYLIMNIEDNGIGIEQSLKVNRIDDHVSHATQITRERVDLFRKITKKNIAFDIKKRSPGTQVTFNLPIQYL